MAAQWMRIVLISSLSLGVYGLRRNDLLKIDRTLPPPFQTSFAVVFGILIISAIIRSTIKRFNIPIPYPAFMVCFGCLWGLICYYQEEVASHTKLLYLYPMDLFYVYVPVLMFKTAFCIETHILMKPLPQILIISIPVYLLSAAFVGILITIIIDGRWTLMDGLFFGNMCNPIYSIEVVRLLREIGAHTKQTSILLEGEAILGLVSVYVVADLLSGHMDGFLVEWYHFVIVFLRFILIALLLGYLLGSLGCFIIRKISSDAISVIVTTLSIPFFCYFIVIHGFGSSGIVSVMVVGIMMGLERTALSVEMDALVTDFWKALCHVMNTYVYTLAGVMTVVFIMDDVLWKDCVLVLVSYVLVNLGRFLGFLLFFPVLSRSGYGMTFRNMQLCTWAGLKSPMSLFSGTVYFVLGQPREKMCAELMFYLVGISLLSFIINGTSTPLLLKIVGISQISLIKQVNMNNCVKYILARRDRAISTLQMDRFLSDTNWPVVEGATMLQHPYEIRLDERNEETEDFFMGYRFTYCPECKKEVFNEPTEKEMKEMSREARLRILKAKKTSYSRQYENGMISKEGTRVLNQSVEVAMDTEEAIIDLEPLFRRFKRENCFNRVMHGKTEIWLIGDVDLKSRKPNKYWRRLCYHAVKSNWFQWFMFAVISLNLVPIVIDLVCHPKLTEFTTKCVYELLIFVIVADTIFFIIFITEFIIRILAYSTVYICKHGFVRYFSAAWNIFDFILLVFYLLDVTIDYLDLIYVEFKRENFILWRVTVALKLLRWLRFLRLFRLCRTCMPKLINYFDRKTDYEIGFAYEIGKGYATGEDEVLELLPHTIDNEKIRELMRAKIEEDRSAMTKLLGLVQKERPWIAITVKTKQAIRTILNSMRDAINELKVSGWVDDVEYAKLMRSLMELYKYVSSIKAVQPSAPRVIFKEITWMAGENSIVEYLFENVATKKFDAGAVICEEGKVAEGIYVVVTGLLMLTYTPRDDVLRDLEQNGCLPIVDYITPSKYHNTMVDYIVSGNCIGEHCLLTDRPYNCRIVADTHSQLYLLTQNVMRRAMEISNDPINGLECRLWKSVSIRTAIAILMDVPAYHSFTQEKIKFTLERAFMPNISNYKMFIVTSMITDVILIEGVVVDFNSNDSYTAPCYIPRNVQKILLPKHSALQLLGINTETKLLIIPEKDVDEYEVMMNEEDICEMVVTDSSKCLLHLIQNRASRMKRRMWKKEGKTEKSIRSIFSEDSPSRGASSNSVES